MIPMRPADVFLLARQLRSKPSLQLCNSQIVVASYRVSQHGTELSVTRRNALRSNTQGGLEYLHAHASHVGFRMTATLWFSIQISTMGRNFIPACLIRCDETPSEAMLKSFL